MAKPRSKSKPTVETIELAPTVTIPLDKLVISEANVRRVTTGLSIEELAESIARRSLLQSLSVRPILADDGEETGTYQVQAGGRRLRALKLLVKQKRLAKDAPVPCIIRRQGLIEDDSLAENNDRQALHPLDQFRAFAALRAKGQSEEDIAAAYGVTATVVRQRLRLASASPVLLQAYAEDAITLEQLMAFCVSEDHARQEQIWELISKGQAHRSAYTIRQLLTETCIEADDPRVRCVGLDAYIAAGGPVMRDLFEDDDGGWLQDPALLMRLLTAKLDAERDRVLAEGWMWAEVCLETPWRRRQELIRLQPIGEALSDEEQAHYEKLSDEYDSLVETLSDDDAQSADARKRLDEIEAALAELDNKPPVFAPEDVARGGALISVAHGGEISIEYGFLKPEDQIASAASAETAPADAGRIGAGTPGGRQPLAGDDDGDAHATTLSGRLVEDLTSYRTLGLRNALAQDYDTAFLAVLHALCLKVFYHDSTSSCLQISAQTHFAASAPGLGDLAAARAVEERQAAWQAKLPRDPEKLWDALVALGREGSLAALFAHCASMTVDAVCQSYQNRSHAMRHADQLAAAVSLDMTEQGWTTTADNYLGRVTKAHILAAVREAKGESAAQLIDHLKKSDMAIEAERLLADMRWLPGPLRSPGFEQPTTEEPDAPPVEDLPAFLTEAGGDDDPIAAAAE